MEKRDERPISNTEYEDITLEIQTTKESFDNEIKKVKGDLEKKHCTILSHMKKMNELEKNNLVIKTEEALKHITEKATVLEVQLKDTINNYENRIEQQRQSYERVSIEMAKSASGQGTVQQTFANSGK